MCVVDAYSRAKAVKEVRLPGSVLISSIIVMSATGDVSVAVSPKVCGPIVEDPVSLYLGGVSGCKSSSCANDTTYMGDETLYAKKMVSSCDVPSEAICKNSGTIATRDDNTTTEGTPIDGDPCCAPDTGADAC